MTNEQYAKLVARKMFEKRGNHSEIHLSEKELADIVEIALDLHEHAKLLQK